MLTRQETNYLGKETYHTQLTTIIGIMGAGKSKLGYIVSKTLNINFYDIAVSYTHLTLPTKA